MGALDGYEATIKNFYSRPGNEPEEKKKAMAQVAGTFGSMSDEQTVAWFKAGMGGDDEHMLQKAMKRCGITLEDIWDGHPIARKLVEGTPLAITTGCDAPDGALLTLEGATTTLHESLKASFNSADLALVIFGSTTCPMFMGKLQSLLGHIRPFIDAGKLGAVSVYIREAHPDDGWSPGDGPFLHVAQQTRQIEDRLKVAREFLEVHSKGLLTDIPFFVDDPTTNALDIAYEAPPARLVVVDKSLKVVFATGQGPNQYDVDSLGAFLGGKLA
mmetsp:Transcript_26724/g.32440  ORF Transcript_26724/g.32440 Transcript_26724/m.32440 type:complete len:272 (+) Transcript_26724:371-1186(+)|eukprot:CAMPEP_0197857140 /NCGR_PEP_ID=MMETSP1438-20131217/29931_1 /TAXON_ID=1461541 /ORGANISM="Pterosperma sp., Strain CCMP1384" /LENGTH=271 /DNA_ID=CAMNT_0043472861 /DNA_START=339 /DNA_END=1154 /DNA_ORIENTATION=+